MNFFERQEKAHSNTKLLVFLYIVSVCAIIVMVYAALVACIWFIQTINASSYFPEPPPRLDFLDPAIFSWVAGSVLLVVMIGTFKKIGDLSGGGDQVMKSLDGTKISPDTTDPDERQLLNIVEEMAIASGTAVPTVYRFPWELGINAFAAGFSTNGAAIGVTEGAVKLLSRDEMQGVIAHEFSHILNGDMKLNMYLMGVLYGILVIAIIGKTALQTIFRAERVRVRSSRDSGGGMLAIFLIGITLVTVGYVGVLFARLIKTAVSRQRECLADASAVQFTRNPDGLAGALKKIGGLMNSSYLTHPRAEEASHLFFADGVGKNFWLTPATHPPLLERVRLLDPSFDGTFPDVKPVQIKPAKTYPEAVEKARTALFRSMQGGFGMAVEAALIAEALREKVGAPNEEDLKHAQNILETMPQKLRLAAHEPVGARAAIFSLLVDRENPLFRERQLEYLRTSASYDVYTKTKLLLDEAHALGYEKRLPLLEVVIPTLKQLDLRQYEQFQKNALEVMRLNEEDRPFEFVIKQLVFHHLDASFKKQSFVPPPESSKTDLKTSAAALLSFLAYVGNADDAKANVCFKTAIKVFEFSPEPQFIPKKPMSRTALEKQLNIIRQASPAMKQKFIHAMVAAIQNDGKITPEELEMVRAFADAVDCPLPPFSIYDQSPAQNVRREHA